VNERGFDPVAGLHVLTAHGVDFVVIGGVAARIWGSPTVTRDLDICYARAPANFERLAAALREVHAQLRGVKDQEVHNAFRLDARTLAAGDSFTFESDVGDLDCLGTPTGTGGYSDLKAGAELVDVDGLKVWVTSLADLIEMKRAAGRHKDRVELEVLGALRDERGARRRP
jgi:predicted nucleotidyltransferase